MKLRDYQLRAITDCRNLIKGGQKSLLLVSPTGSGKTVIGSELVRLATGRGKSVLFLAHRKELIDQASRKLDAFGVDHGVIMSGHHRYLPTRQVQVASVQTLVNRLDHPLAPRPDLVLIDEAHRSIAPTYFKILERYPSAVTIGLTATPCRSDGQGLRELYQNMVLVAGIQDLIDEDHLVKPRVYAPSTPNLGGVKKSRGDYVEKALAAACDQPDLVGDIVTHWQRIAQNRLTVVFAVDVAHSQHIRDEFRRHGIAAEHIDGNTPKVEREGVLDRWRRGITRVVCNCQILTEGFDLPEMAVCVLARPTLSTALYLQMAGRVLRPDPASGKAEAVILDHAGCVHEHGLPQDPREWSLDGIQRRAKAAEDTAPTVQVCESCFTAFDRSLGACPACGWEPESKPREIVHVDGQLEEIDPDQAKRDRRVEQGAATTLEELIQLGRQRGYRNPYAWAKHVLGARSKRHAA